MTILTAEQITEMAQRVHKANAKWWTHLESGFRIERNVGELLMLCISELSEALEGDRKNLMDDKLPHRKMLEVELADAFIRTLDIIGGLQTQTVSMEIYGSVSSKNTAENLMLITRLYVKAHDEHTLFTTSRLFGWTLCKILACLLDLAVSENLDLMDAYEEKMVYNAQREDHKIEARKAAGGKKY